MLFETFSTSENESEQLIYVDDLELSRRSFGGAGALGPTVRLTAGA